MFPKKKAVDYSHKNIPIPGRDQYMKQLIDKTEYFLKKLRWKVILFNQKQNKNIVPCSDSDREDTAHKGQFNFGFKSEKTPPPVKELISFESDVFNLI